MPVWAVQLIIAVVMALASYMIQRRAMKKNQSGVEAQEFTTPTVDAGRSIPVVFGRVRVTSPNLLWMGGNRSKEIKK